MLVNRQRTKGFHLYLFEHVVSPELVKRAYINNYEYYLLSFLQHRGVVHIDFTQVKGLSVSVLVCVLMTPENLAMLYLRPPLFCCI